MPKAKKVAQVEVMPAVPPPPPTLEQSLAPGGPPPALHTETDFIALFDFQIDGLCREMGQTSNALTLQQLRADVREVEARKEMVKSVFAESRQREQQLMATFLLYQRNVPFDGLETLTVAAEINGLDSQNLTYKQFRNLMLDEDNWQIAEQAVQEVYVHELEQKVRQIDSYRSTIDRRLAKKRRRFARRMLSDGR